MFNRVHRRKHKENTKERLMNRGAFAPVVFPPPYKWREKLSKGLFFHDLLGKLFRHV